MKRVLIANIFGIGDVLFTTPLIASLKKGIEGVSVDYLCNARTRDVVESDPDVDRIFVYEKDDYIRLWRQSKSGCVRALRGLFSAVRRQGYDAVFDFTLSRRFGFFFRLAGIPRRIGLDYKRRGIFLTDRVPFGGFKERHVIEYYLDLLKCLNVPASVREMQLVPDEEILEWASMYLEDRGVGGGRLIAVIPGGGASWGAQAPRKRWPAEKFLQTADILSGQSLKVAFFGDLSETALCRDIAGRMKKRPVMVENNLTLRQFSALLKRCDLALCNDGGPLHIAVALGIKTVSIFGPVDDRVYGPYPASDRHKVVKAEKVPCRPCYSRFRLPECRYNNRCLTDIGPEAAAEACLGLLDEAEE